MFAPDKPISHPDQDILNRKGFAASLARALRNWNEDVSLVTALYGDWGSGKSSVKSLIWHSLSDEPATCPIVIEFNPWMYGSTEALADAFFRELSIAIGKSTDKDKEEKANRLLLYGKMAAAGSRIVKYAKEFIPVPLIGSLVEKGFASLGEEFKEGGDLLKTELEASEKTLLELKATLVNDLRSLPKPILVFIDDIDRLTVDETRLLFQLIKANADFPNLIYFLMFQRDIVEKSLTVEDKINGKQYLEKIVQVGFTLPPLHKDDIQKFLFQELDKILAVRNLSTQFDYTNWQLLYKNGLDYYFNNLRNVHRFLNTYNFHLGLFGDTNADLINPLDLLVVEVFRLFNDELYQKIYSMRPSILEPENGYNVESVSSTARNKQGHVKLQGTIAHNELQDFNVLLPTQEEARAFNTGMSYLFRTDAQQYNQSGNELLNLCRLKAPEYFDRYFHFVL